jgi:hypothetical protein
MKFMSLSSINSGLLALLFAGVFAFVPAKAADSAPVATAAPTRVGLVLPARPSVLLRAPLLEWEPLLKDVGVAIEERTKQVATLTRAEQIELSIHRLMLAQTRQARPQVLEALEQARRLQESESGRQTAGLLNEMLAHRAIQKGDSAWLKQALKARVLAMPWAEVEPSIRLLRDQVASMQSEGVETYAQAKLDVGASMSKNEVTMGFVMQLMGLRFQLLEVLPQRAALLVALDEAIAERSPSAGSR